MAGGFVHLHLHSEYSMLDSVCRLENLVKEAEKQGLETLAITDHHSMGGVVQFYRLAREHGIKPVIGVELNVGSIIKEDAPEVYHLVLLAKDNQGYANILSLITTSNLTNDGLITRSMLENHKQGLIALSGCSLGELDSKLLKEPARAREVALEYRNIFGQKNYYIELIRTGLAGEEEVIQEKRKLASDLNIPLVATNDVHYLKREDAGAHQALREIQRLSFEEVYPVKRREEYYLKTVEEMEKLFTDIPEAIQNTVHIADRCNVFLDFEQRNFPRFPLPVGYSAESYLRFLAEERFAANYGEAGARGIAERLDSELREVNRLGATGYFLIVWDLVRFAREQGLLTFVRGRANGSLLCYLLGMTTIDPLNHRLNAENFFNTSSQDLPVLELGFDGGGQRKVFQYLTEKYGELNVAHIPICETLDPSTILRDLAKAQNWPREKLARFLRLLALKGLPLNSLARASSEEEAELEKIADIIQKLEGLPRHLKQHPSGVVIAEDVLSNYTALQYAGDGEVITQLDGSAIKTVGLLHLCLIGMRQLSVVRQTLQLLKEAGKAIKPEAVPLNDPKTFRLLQRGETAGCFELDNEISRKLLQDIRPVVLKEIIFALALQPKVEIERDLVDTFILRLHGIEDFVYPLPLLKETLRDTQALIIFEEQILEIAHLAAGFSSEEAVNFLKELQQKNRLKQAAIKSKFVKGASTRGFTSVEANYLFDQLQKRAESLSSLADTRALARLAYLSAYLKAHHPAEYLAALMNVNRDLHPRFRKYANRDRYFCIQILPADINASQPLATVVDGKIRQGFLLIKGISARVAKEIVTVREARLFSSLEDFCQRVDLRVVNHTVLENLIRARAFDSFGPRKKLLHYLNQVFGGEGLP